MEPSSREKVVSGVPAGDVGWTDLGSWNAVYELMPRDGAANVARTTAIFDDATGCYVETRGKLVALAGVKNLVVVETDDALLVVDRTQAQKVSALVKLLEQHKRHELL